MINHVVLIGRLTKDPELAYTVSGKAFTQFILAVNRRYSENDEKKRILFAARHGEIQQSILRNL